MTELKIIQALKVELTSIDSNIQLKLVEIEVLKAKHKQTRLLYDNAVTKQKKFASELKFTEEFQQENSVKDVPENMEINVVPSLIEEVHQYIHNIMCNDDNDLDEDDITNTSQLVNPNDPHDRVECKFGDILDTMGNRHYGYRFVGKDGAIINTKRTHEMVLDQEYGVTVPYEICKYLTDSVNTYKNIECNRYIAVYELPFYDATVQKYKVQPGNLYEYRQDVDVYDHWDLYVIHEGGSEHKADLK
tara:strand:- start:69 stop:806 length:738 start_codon:yes stop_codon:yes gene_type:complete